MTQESCLQATVSELLNEWLHRAQRKHKFYDPPHNSRVARQLCVSAVGRRSSDPVTISARILQLDRNSFLFERKTFSGFGSVNLKKDVSGGTETGFNGV